MFGIIYDWKTEDIFITVKAYPNPSKKYKESVCTAGITKNGNWIRLYPVKYRQLPKSKQFKKYQWIQAKISKNQTDKRPESYYLDHKSIKILKEEKDWPNRDKYLLKYVDSSIENLQAKSKSEDISLGLIKPASIDKLIIEKTESDWKKGHLKVINQISLFDKNPKNKLKKIPYIFKYKFKCNNKKCTGHKLKIVDWEINALYLNCSYSDNPLDLVKQKYEEEFINKKDLYFFVGTPHSQHRFGTFIIIGVYYPPKTRKIALF